MELVLRIYTIPPGELDEWVDEWREHVVRRAARRRLRDAPSHFRAGTVPGTVPDIAEARQLSVRAVDAG